MTPSANASASSATSVAHVVADDDRAAVRGPPATQQAGERGADVADGRGVELLADDAADVVGLHDRPDRSAAHGRADDPSGHCGRPRGAGSLPGHAQSSAGPGSTRRWPRRPVPVAGTASTGRSARPASRTASASAVRSSVLCCGRGELALEPHHLPAARGGEPVRVLGAQVVGVRLGLRGERADDRRRVGVDVGERGHRELGAPGPRTPPHTQHVLDDSASRPRSPARDARRVRRAGDRPRRPDRP